jgi:cell division septum initiation protein DivIVA
VDIEQSPYQYSQQLLDQLSREIQSLKEENQKLKQQNNDLKEQLEKLREGQTDMFSSLSEKERLAYRSRIQQLISKIDKHLENSS